MMQGGMTRATASHAPAVFREQRGFALLSPPYGPLA